ncbi:hypothetical protein Pla22_23390 [Rubripirellula amarantea]|uniref:Uncharacterized protein n=1 Tax=Rubripirellula amarantea TaxID=2527999 RepID=A0A5C5WWT5_9BACT|nr:hypothetical protein Pla22_23390 [Rubripirellula amarantea]
MQFQSKLSARAYRNPTVFLGDSDRSQSESSCDREHERKPTTVMTYRRALTAGPMIRTTGSPPMNLSYFGAGFPPDRGSRIVPALRSQ